MRAAILSVLALTMLGCTTKPQSPEVKALSEVCSRRGERMYWRVSCDNVRFLPHSPLCYADAWTGEKETWKQHDKEWHGRADTASEATTNLIHAIATESPEVARRTVYDSDIQECDPQEPK
jgi:hypothetical protein